MHAIKTDREKLHENLVFGTSEILQSLFSKEDKILFLQEAVKGLVKKAEYADFLKYLAAEVCRDISIAEISENTGLVEKQVCSFLKFFEDICIIKKVDNYENIPERSKYYFLDNGVRNAILDDFRTVEERMDYEKLFENYVAMARVKKFECFDEDRKFFFWKTGMGKEMPWVEGKGEYLESFGMKAGSLACVTDWIKMYPRAGFQKITELHLGSFLTSPANVCYSINYYV